jgi:acetyl esterase/lipase
VSLFRSSLALALVMALAACSMNAPKSPEPSAAPAAELMKWPDLLERPRPEPDTSIPYGEDQMQVVDLWLPPGRGPHPTVLMVHGGCWQTEIADRRIMNWIADDLRKRGIAVWNIDYRGVDRTGGGYPGTFQDVAAATDLLRDSASKYHLDLSRLVAVGHSAGGHLALWLAGRIDRDSETAPFEMRIAVDAPGVESGELDRATEATLEKIRSLPGFKSSDSLAETGRFLASARFARGTDAAAALEEARRLLPDLRGALPARAHDPQLTLVDWIVPPDSPLFGDDPLRPLAVVSAGGLPDLKLTETPPGTGCGTEIVRSLVGSPSASRPDVFADTSVVDLPRIHARQYLVNGPEDRIIPLFFAEDYAGKRRAKGERVEVHVVPHTGHVELVAPETAAWRQQVDLIEGVLHQKPQTVRLRIK